MKYVLAFAILTGSALLSPGAFAASGAPASIPANEQPYLQYHLFPRYGAGLERGVTVNGSGTMHGAVEQPNTPHPAPVRN